MVNSPTFPSAVTVEPQHAGNNMNYDAPTGKCVLPVLLLIRLVILGAAVWSDDEETFHCDAIQPGCQTACFDALTPLSLPRLWTLQVGTNLIALVNYFQN